MTTRKKTEADVKQEAREAFEEFGLLAPNPYAVGHHWHPVWQSEFTSAAVRALDEALAT